MSRLLALEWSETEARFAVASARGGRVTIEQAFSASMRPGDWAPGQPAPEAGQRIAAVLAQRKVGRIDTLVAIGRASIELRQLSIPPCPDEEVADLVRFTALREFNALEEDWPLDFLPIDEVPDQPRTVLAAAISPELVEQIQRTCQTAGLKPRRLILRPCGAASLFCRQQEEGRPRARLLVDLLVDEADLTVIIDRKVIFLRTARLPGDPLTHEEPAQALLAELRRTMAAVQNQLAGRKVESIVLFGTGEPHAALARFVDERLGTPTEVFDPFSGLDLGEELAGALPEHPGRFAPLLGMLLDELYESPHGVDFLHPRRRPRPPSRRKYYLAAAAAAAVLLAGTFLSGWLYCASLDRQADALQAQVAELDRRWEELARVEKAVKEIQQWKDGDLVWLDELRWLAEKLPDAKKTMLTEMRLEAAARGGAIRFRGLASDVAAIQQIGEELRKGPEGTRQVEAKGAGASTQQKPYEFQFNSSVNVPPEKRP
ncbi:MAG: hypothetical protein ACUVUC_07120 [Thermoguttaceae bacterium]